MPLVRSAGTRRPPRVTTRRPRLAGDRRVRRSSAARVGARSRGYVRDARRRSPVGIELFRATLLVALAVLAITVVLPGLLELAASPLR